VNLRMRANPIGREYRDWDMDELECRQDEGSDKVIFEGVASVVDKSYTVRDMFGEFTETVTRGAFDRTLASKADVALFVSHQSDAPPLATRSAGSLRLTADPHLRVKAFMNPARVDVQNARHAVADGEMRQMSIGFSVPKDKQTWNDDYTVRTIHEVNLVEASIVWRGASPTTSASVRSLQELIAEFNSDDPDEIRRAIAHLESLLPVEQEEQRAAPVLTGMYAQLQAKRELTLI
jgi:HK97 family phage prohead protease